MMNKVHPKNVNQENISLTVYADNTYMDEAKESTVKEEIENINNFLHNSTAYAEIDRSLSKSGAAAESKATGDAINTLSDNINTINSKLDTKAPAYTYGTTDLVDGVSPLPTGQLYFVY